MPGMWINPQPGILRYPFSFTFMVISFLEGVAQKTEQYSLKEGYSVSAKAVKR
jgi:hypothetical protein|tara:strand:- start:8271 stop:8429 length:159 start_codon:yes stop_codon:yes gene_type:complete